LEESTAVPYGLIFYLLFGVQDHAGERCKVQ